MTDAVNIIKNNIPPEEELKGSVKIGVDFERINMLAGSGADEELERVLGRIRENHEVIPQYRGIKEKIGGMMYGFYINPAVSKQNQLNASLAVVCDEYDKLRQERNALVDRINKLQAEILKLTQELS